MNRVAHITVRVLFGLILIAATAALLWRLWLLNSMRQQIRSYSGEGSIVQTGNDILTLGYRVDFPVFDLGSNFEHTYLVAKLPDAHNDVWFGVAFTGELTAADLLRDGHLHIRVTSSDGQIAFDHEAQLAEWTFSWFEDQCTIYYLNSQNQGTWIDHRTSKRLRNFRVEIMYQAPKQAQSPLQGHLQFRSGGRL